MRLCPLLSNNKDFEHNTWHTLTSRSVISMSDPHLALTFTTWTNDHALYLVLYLTGKYHTLDTCSVFQCIDQCTDTMNDLMHFVDRSMYTIAHVFSF